MATWNPLSLAGYRNIRNTYRDVLPQETRAKINSGLNYVSGGLFKPVLAAEKEIGGFIDDEARPGQIGYTEPTQTEEIPGETSADTSTDTTGGTTGGTARTPEFKVIDGVRYDLNDPAQFQAYISKADEILNADFDFFSKRTNEAKELDIAQAKAQEEEVLEDIKRALVKIGEQEGDYNTEYARSLQDLAEGFNQGSARRQSFYASIAPRVYQSSQGTSQQYAEGKYQEGQKRYEEQKEKDMRAFGEARSDYARQEEKIKNQFNLFKTQREQQAQDALAEQARTVQRQRDSAMSGAFNYAGEMRQATGNNKWNAPTFQSRDLSGYSPANVNLNELMSFIKFQPQAAMQSGTQGMKTQSIGTPDPGDESLNQYMGYEQNQSDPLNLYKQGLA